MSLLEEEDVIDENDFSSSLENELHGNNLHKIEMEVQKTLQVEGDSIYTLIETSQLQFNEEGILKGGDKPDFGNFLSAPSSPANHPLPHHSEQNLFRQLFKDPHSPAPSIDNRSPSPFYSFFQNSQPPPSPPRHLVSPSPQQPPIALSSIITLPPDFSVNTMNLLMTSVTSLQQRIDSMEKRMQEQQQTIEQLQMLLFSAQAIQQQNHQQDMEPVSQTPVNYTTTSQAAPMTPISNAVTMIPTSSGATSTTTSATTANASSRNGPFYCAEHNKTFTTSSNYQRHLREVHNKQRRSVNAKASTPMRPHRPEDEDMKEEEDENLTQEMSTLNVK